MINNILELAMTIINTFYNNIVLIAISVIAIVIGA